MAAGGLCYLAGQVVYEHELGSLQPSPRGNGSRRSLEEALTALRKGALLLKHGRHGKPKVHFFRLGACDTLLRWRGASGSVKQVRLRNVTEVVSGQTTEVFRRCPLRPSARCFSLRYRDEDGTSRTLDLTSADEQQYELWLVGLRVVAERLRTLGTPVTGAAAGPAAPAGRGGSTAGGSLLAGSAGGVSASALAGAGAPAGGLSPAELSKCVAGSRALQRLASGPVAIPVAERTPCDLLAWGSAQRAPPTAPSLRSVLGVAEECWQRRSLPGLVPAGCQLDAYCAAVGRKHAAAITATGALFTWGEGRGGKLGLGHDQDQPVPQRVRHGLEGQVAVAVACGDDCTAALTEAGELFMWGRLHADSPPQLVPLHVRGELRGRKVTQISCGPFHCAAVTADGGLFTWGEGFGGKLGHGDQSSRTHPTQVAAFAGRQVLEVACGVWHTAAIVAEPEGAYAQPLAAGLQHSPMRLESVGGADALAGFDPAAAHAAGVPSGIPPASPVHPGAAHHRNNSTSSAFSEASIFHDGQGGALFTWGGVNESVAFGSSEKHDSNKGCLGHGEVDLYRGQLLPTRVGGALDSRQVRHVAAGSHLTVAVTTSGRVYQMGATGASGPVKNCPWEGATLPELVRGALQGFFVDEVSCGMHHCVALGRPADRKTGRPAAEPAPRAVFAWGRGSEGQLGVKGFEDSPAPVLVDALKGRQVLQVSCGGSNSMAVCEHNTGRWEPDSKEEAEAALRALYALTVEPKPASGKQLRIQAPGEDRLGPLGPGRYESEQQMGRGSGGMGGIVRRSLSVIVRGSGGASVAGSAAAAGGQPGGTPAPPTLARTSSSSVRSGGGASVAGSARGLAAAPSSGAISVVYSIGGGYRSQAQLGRESQGHPLQHPPHRTSMQRVQSNRSGSGALGSDYGSIGGAGSGSHRVVSIGSPVKAAGHQASGSGSGFARRATYAGGGSAHGGGMTSARSFTALSGGGAASFGRASDRSSLSSWHHNRAHSDDGRAHDNEADSAGAALGHGGHSGQHALSSSDLAGGMDDVRSGSSVAALQDELAEKNRIIDRLQRKVEKLQLAAQRPASVARPSASHSADVEARLRESVELSAGAFRAAQQAGGAGSRPAACGRPSRPPTPHGLPSAPSTIPEEDQHVQLAAMEQLLAKKEALLDGQQQKLAAWAAELQRRELLLAQQKALLQGRAGAGGGLAGSSAAAAGGLAVGAGRVGTAHSVSFSPVESRSLQPPIPCDSPVIVGRPGAAGTGAAASPLVRRAVEEAAAVTPPSSGGLPAGAEHDGGVGTPGTPAVPGEWQEEFEPGVHLTFTSEGGVTKLKRIRFSRALFSADSAKQWYEANKHLLAQPTSTPRPAALNGGGLLPAGSGSLGSASQPGTPVSLPAGQQTSQAPPAAQAPAHAPQQREGGDAASGAGAGADAVVQAGLLHFRQTSRNLSFDARELAAFHERLQALASQQGGPAAGAGPAGLPPQHRPSRLSVMSSRPAAAAGAAAAVAAAGAADGAEPSIPVPKSPCAASPPPGEQQQQAAEAEGLAEVSMLAGIEGEASRPFLSAQSSPQSQPLPADGSLAGTPRSAAEPAEPAAGDEQAALRSAANLASHSLGLDSCASSPIRASVGSRGSSPLSKQRSVPSVALAKQPSGVQAEAGKGPAAQVALPVNPRVSNAAAGGGAERSGSEHSSSGSSTQGSPPEAGGLAAAAGRPTSVSPGGALSRLRRSLTGSPGGKKR